MRDYDRQNPPPGYDNVRSGDSDLAMAARQSPKRTAVSGFMPNDNKCFLIVLQLNYVKMRNYEYN